jgi:predicted N-acetyltransferase YhbS
VPAFVKELDFVACDGDKIVGYIMYSKAKIINEKNEEFEVLCMGPLAVAPAQQKQWIGSMLMKHSTEKAKEMWYKAVIIFGDPEYYHRFGFVNAEKYNIQTSDGQNFEPFMALELYENSLQGISGKFYTDKVFETDSQELEEFEKGFPMREKHITDTQLKM